MSRRKIVTGAERALLLAELEDAEDALRETGALLDEEPTKLRDGVEARERLASAQSELARVAEAAQRVRSSSSLQQLLAESDASAARTLPRDLDRTLGRASDRLGAAVERLDEVDRALAENRPDRADRPLDEASEDLRAAKADKAALAERVTEAKRRVDDAPQSDWIDAVTALVPVEVIAGWTAIQAIVGVDEPALDAALYWAVFAVVLVATYLHVRRDIVGDSPVAALLARRSGSDEPAPASGRPAPDGGVRRPRDRLDVRIVSRWSDRVQTLLAVGAFVVWAYYLEGPFVVAGVHDPTLAAVLLPLYTLAGVQLVSSYTAILAGTELRLRGLVGRLGGAVGRSA